MCMRALDAVRARALLRSMHRHSLNCSPKHLYAIGQLSHSQDAAHVNAFFRRAGIATLTTRELFDFAVDPTITLEGLDDALDALARLAASRPAGAAADEDAGVAAQARRVRGSPGCQSGSPQSCSSVHRSAFLMTALDTLALSAALWPAGAAADQGACSAARTHALGASCAGKCQVLPAVQARVAEDAWLLDICNTLVV